MKTGLVLEGGAMRGLFSVGVTDVMMENNIEYDGIIGVSAGAAFGCNYKSKQNGRAIRYNLKYCRDKRYFSLRSLITTGDLFGADFCYHELPEKLDVFDKEAFDSNPTEFYIVCTDVITGKPVYKRCDTVDYDCLEWVRASASMPLASRIVEVGGYKLLDGGISDSIPLKYFESLGYNKNIVILTQPKGYVKKKNSFMPAVKIALRKYPNIVNAIENRHIMYNNTTKYIFDKAEKGEILVICPDEPLPIGHTERNPEILKKVYEAGRRKAYNMLDEIKTFTGKAE